MKIRVCRTCYVADGTLVSFRTWSALMKHILKGKHSKLMAQFDYDQVRNAQTYYDAKPDPRKDGKFYAPSGASSRSKAIDFTLMVWEAVVAIVNRFQYGLDNGHDRNNWRKGKDDPIFISERLNHGMQHYQNLLSGTRPDGSAADWTDVEAALCNLAMATWWRRNGSGLRAAFPWLMQSTGGIALEAAQAMIARKDAQSRFDK